MTVLVDSNVLLDVSTGDSDWAAWSKQALAHCSETDVLAINALIYAEVSVGFQTIEALDRALPAELLVREPLPYGASFLAGKAFVAYRRRGGARASPLPDFYIGAHAALLGHRLLTRDPRPYRTYFPRLALVAPD